MRRRYAVYAVWPGQTSHLLLKRFWFRSNAVAYAHRFIREITDDLVRDPWAKHWLIHFGITEITLSIRERVGRRG